MQNKDSLSAVFVRINLSNDLFYGNDGTLIVGITVGTTLDGTTFGITVMTGCIGIAVETITGEVGNEVLIPSTWGVAASEVIGNVGVIGITDVEIGC